MAKMTLKEKRDTLKNSPNFLVYIDTNSKYAGRPKNDVSFIERKVGGLLNIIKRYAQLW